MATLVIEIEVAEDARKGAVGRITSLLSDEEITSINWKSQPTKPHGPVYRSKEALDGPK